MFELLSAGGLLLVLGQTLSAVELRRETLNAFGDYVRAAEQRLAARVGGAQSFLWLDEPPALRQRARRGEILAEPWNARGDTPVNGGLIHHWMGAVFIPDADLSQVLALLRDYDRHYRIYQPEVVASKVLWRLGDRYGIYLRLLKKKVLTVILNTEHEVTYYPLDATRWHSRSYSTRVAQVVNPGQAGERELPEGNDQGFLWRLYSYWRFQARDGGVYVECEAVSLTRDIPTGLGWLIGPMVRELPRQSLAATLESTRRALRK